MLETRSFADESAYLKKYLAKYPDRVDVVNAVVAVYNLGALEPELLSMLVANTERIERLSGKKDAFDARPRAYGYNKSAKRKKAARIDLDDDEETEPEQVEAAEPVKVKPVKLKNKISVQQRIYDLLKASAEPISNDDLMRMVNIKEVHILRNYISLIRKTLVQPDESLATIAEHRTSQVKHYQLKKR